MKNEVDGRREIASRNTAWANNIARKLTRWGVTPNQISMMSVFFAMVGCLPKFFRMPVLYSFVYKNTMIFPVKSS